MLTNAGARAASLALIMSAGGALPPVAAFAQELVPHLAVYDVTTGRAPPGVTPPTVRGTYVFRLQAECDGVMKFEQRLRFEVRGPGGASELDQSSAGSESADGKRYQFTHKTSVDGKVQPEVRGGVDLGDKGEATAHFSHPAGRTVTVPSGTLFPVSILRRTVKAARAGEEGFDGRFFIGDKPEAPQAVSVLLGKPPRRVAELPLPQGDRDLVSGQDRFYFRASFYDDEARGSGEPRHEMSSVTLHNGIEIWGTHEQGELRLEYNLIRIEAAPKPDC
jgi:hypothetical protein